MKFKTILLLLALCVAVGANAQNSSKQVTKEQKKYLKTATEYLNIKGKLPNVAAARQALDNAKRIGAEGTAEYEIVAGDVEVAASGEAARQSDKAMFVFSQAAFNHYKKAYAAALNKNPEIVKRAQEGALWIYKETYGLSSIAMSYSIQNEYSKALEAYHEAMTAYKEPVLTSNPMAQNAIKQYSESSFISQMAEFCFAAACGLEDTAAAIKEMEFVKNRIKDEDKKNQLYQILAMRYYSVDNLSAYESTLKEGAEKTLGEPWYTERLLNLYTIKGDYVSANQWLDKVIAKDPNNDVLYRIKGITLQEQNKMDEALTCFQKALKLDPNSVFNNVAIGRYYILKGDIDKAILYHEKAYSLDAEHSESMVGDNLNGLYSRKISKVGATSPEGKRLAEKQKKVAADYGLEVEGY